MKSREFLYERIKSHDKNFYIPKKYYFSKLCDKLKSDEILTRHDLETAFSRNITGAELFLSRKNIELSRVLLESEDKIFQDLLEYFLIYKHIYSDVKVEKVDLSKYALLNDTGFGVVVDGVLFSVGFDNDIIYVRPVFRSGRVLSYNLIMKIVDKDGVNLAIKYDCQVKSCDKYYSSREECKICSNCSDYNLPSPDKVSVVIQNVLTAISNDLDIQEFEDVEISDVNANLSSVNLSKNDSEINTSFDRDIILKVFSDINFTNRTYKYI